MNKLFSIAFAASIIATGMVILVSIACALPFLVVCSLFLVLFHRLEKMTSG